MTETILKKENKNELKEVLTFINEMSEEEVKDLKNFLQGVRYAKEINQKLEKKIKVVEVKKPQKGA